MWKYFTGVFNDFLDSLHPRAAQTARLVRKLAFSLFFCLNRKLAIKTLQRFRAEALTGQSKKTGVLTRCGQALIFPGPGAFGGGPRRRVRHSKTVSGFHPERRSVPSVMGRGRFIKPPRGPGDTRTPERDAHRANEGLAERRETPRPTGRATEKGRKEKRTVGAGKAEICGWRPRPKKAAFSGR